MSGLRESIRFKTRGKTAFLLPALLCALTVLSCAALYRFDNKYTSGGPQALNGVLLLDGQSLSRYPVLFLVHGWEFYNGRLLAPEDFGESPPVPDKYIYIGQYGGFEAGDISAQPHGSASYRLNIIVPEETRTYMLELPEIFSAYRVYVNGREAAGMGEPGPSAYRPETGNRTVSFEAAGRIELLVAVTDYSHIYSGMVYPPAFGSPDAVLALLNYRLAFRSVLCAAAATVGLLAALVALLSRKNAAAALYGLMCLSFVGYAGWPVTRTLARGFYPFYAVENLSFCAMLAAVMLLQIRVCGVENRPGRRFALFGFLICLASSILSLALPFGNLRLMVFYSGLIAAYKWVTAGFITFTAFRAARNQTVNSGTLLCGILVFDCGLVMDRLLPVYEPIVSGWFPELAGFVLVLSVGAVVGQEVAAEYLKSAVLEERASSMERLSRMQQTYYPLLQERIEEAKAARHDLHHHFVMIAGFLENNQPERLRDYVEQYRFSIRADEPLSYSRNDTANILAHHYARLAEKHGIELELRLDIGSETSVADADLCSLLSNLLENAVEACLRQTSGNRFISLAAGQKKSALAVRMVNSGGGAISDGSGFFSSKSEGRKGYGLESVKAVARRYAGSAEFSYDENSRVFTSTVLLETTESRGHSSL